MDVYVRTSTHEFSCPLEVGLQMAVIYPTWVLGTEL